MLFGIIIFLLSQLLTYVRQVKFPFMVHPVDVPSNKHTLNLNFVFINSFVSYKNLPQLNKFMLFFLYLCIFFILKSQYLQSNLVGLRYIYQSDQNFFLILLNKIHTKQTDFRIYLILILLFWPKSISFLINILIILQNLTRFLNKLAYTIDLIINILYI